MSLKQFSYHFILILSLFFFIAPLVAKSYEFSLKQEFHFNKVIIWGHKLYSDTHSYVHHAYYRTFKHLEYDTYWFDDNDDIHTIDFSNSLFIVSGDNNNIPLRKDCRYILHNCQAHKYKVLSDQGNCIFMQVFTWDALTNHDSMLEMEKFVLYSVKDKTIYMPWATDLLPYEIDNNKLQISKRKKGNSIYWIGTIWDGTYGNIDKLYSFNRACKENNIQFIHQEKISLENNIELIQKSFLAPAIQGKWQCEKGYIPCRIFKNISYGQFGITNSKTVYDLFEGKIVYNQDTYQLFYDALNKIKNLDINELYELMDFVKTKHTYINRINCLLKFLDMVKPL